jgi:actin cytoskeleton-regulatory complex protein PAN1
MYLCNLKLTGKELPDKVPEKIMNEVSSMVDIISFGIPDSVPTSTSRTNVPNFDVTAPATQSPAPQPQPSNLQALASLGTQPTGYSGFGGLPTQATGLPGQSTPQQGFSPQQAGFQPSTPSQQAGFQSATRTQQPGFQSSTPGLSFQYSIMQQSGNLAPVGISALQSQPTGRPGQWGFVNAPAGSMAGIQALQQQLMPQPGREGTFSSTGLQGTANIPWAVTKDEKL